MKYFDVKILEHFDVVVAVVSFVAVAVVVVAVVVR